MSGVVQAYVSPFAGWHQQASVRSMPAPSWVSHDPGRGWPEEVQRLLAHPAAPACAKEAIGALQLGALQMTVALECQLIAPVTLDIAARRLQAEYADAVIADALRVQCDEAYHAILACELIERMQSTSGIRLAELPNPFLAQVETLVRAFPAKGEATLIRFCAAVVSETLITRTLKDGWKDDGLRSDIRAFLRHHYDDELRHGAFFSQLLPMVWAQWPERLRARLRPLWDVLVDGFLAAEASMMLAVLEGLGFPVPLASEIALAARGEADSALHRVRSAQLTFHTLRRAGALPDQVSRPVASEVR
jgi:hypothetical protein